MPKFLLEDPSLALPIADIFPKPLVSEIPKILPSFFKMEKTPRPFFYQSPTNLFSLVWFGLVYRRLPEQKVPNLHFSLMCSISSSEVPTRFEGGARATELESSGALVERLLEWVLPLPRPGMMEEDEL